MAQVTVGWRDSTRHYSCVPESVRAAVALAKRLEADPRFKLGFLDVHGTTYEELRAAVQAAEKV